jgi:two-component system, NarL family, nitrate/nitrite response regulator NarL
MTASTATLDPAPSHAVVPLRVVIADDHPVYRDGIARALTDARRYRIVGATGDGEVALRLIARHRPDAALLDLRMPTLDGLEILRRLQRDGIHVPVVLLSAFTQPEIVDQALTAGAAGYLSKDAPRDDILAALDAAALDAAALGASIVPDATAQTHPQPPLLPAERALLQLLGDGWTASDLPGLTGLDAGTIERHLLDAAVKLGTRRIDDTLTRALARGLLD